jgi:hypothetical protein
MAFHAGEYKLGYSGMTAESPKQRHRDRQRAERRAVKEAAAAAARPVVDQPALAPDLAPPPARIGPGRPAGAGNRATREWVRVLIEKHGSPLERLLEIASKDLEALREELRCDRLEAFDRQMTCLKEALPYLHQRLPQSIQVDGAPLMPVMIAVSGAIAQRIGAAVENQQDQRLIEGEPA